MHRLPYRRVVIAAAMIAALFAVSCTMEEHRDPVSVTDGQPQTTAQWTVLYYGAGNYAADLDREGHSRTDALFDVLSNIGSSSDVRIAALVASSSTGGNCRFYEINPLSRQATATLIADWGQQSMASPQTLADFAAAAAARLPAHKYALIVSGSGEGWQGACRDEVHAAGQIMSLVDFSQALSAVSNTDRDGNPFGMIVWTNPLMGTVEVAHELKDISDYVIATPEREPFDHSRALAIWLRDLLSEPSLNSETLGRIVMRAVGEVAEDQEIPSRHVMFETAKSRNLAEVLNNYSSLLVQGALDAADQIQALRDEAWIAETDDSLAVDLGAFVDLVAADPVFGQLVGLSEATDSVKAALRELATDYRSTRMDDPRLGIMIHFPDWAQQLDPEAYARLSFAVSCPSWVSFQAAFIPVKRDPISVSGLVRYIFPQAMINLHVFLLTGTQWSDIVSVQHVDFEPMNATGDSALYIAAPPIALDSVHAKIGMFIDADSNGFDAGDYYGIHSRSGGSWYDLKPGDVLESIEIFVNQRR